MEQAREDGPYHERVQGRTLLREGEKVSMGRKDTSRARGPMSPGRQREGHIRIRKEGVQMRGTHPLETADGGACQATEKRATQ